MNEQTPKNDGLPDLNEIARQARTGGVQVKSLEEVISEGATHSDVHLANPVHLTPEQRTAETERYQAMRSAYAKRQLGKLAQNEPSSSENDVQQ
jgi:hypothetical protein